MGFSHDSLSRKQRVGWRLDDICALNIPLGIGVHEFQQLNTHSPEPWNHLWCPNIFRNLLCFELHLFLRDVLGLGNACQILYFKHAATQRGNINRHVLPTFYSCLSNPRNGHTHSVWSRPTCVKLAPLKQNTMGTPQKRSISSTFQMCTNQRPHGLKVCLHKKHPDYTQDIARAESTRAILHLQLLLRHAKHQDTCFNFNNAFSKRAAQAGGCSVYPNLLQARGKARCYFISLSLEPVAQKQMMPATDPSVTCAPPVWILRI